MLETAPTVDVKKMDDFGVRLKGVFENYKTDRKAAEDRWLQNMRQFRGIYDADIQRMIPKDCSKAYPKLTRWKVIGTHARLMQMLFPQSEKNYGIAPSPLPDLSVTQLQEVLDGLVQEAAQAQGVEPADVTLDDIVIEKAVFDYAKGKAERMEKKIDDDLQEMEYITLARKVVFSAVLYNIGVIEGPLHVKKKARTWKKDTNTGLYTAQEVTKLAPRLDWCPVWEYYPDMSAKSLDKQDGTFRRRIMTRLQVQELADRPGFLADRIKEWLNKNPTGNHKLEHWESQILAEPKGDKTTVKNTDSSKYEVLSYYGGVTGHELRAAGIEVKDGEVGQTFNGETWFLDNKIIMTRLLPIEEYGRRFHEFVFEEDDLSLMGNGQCDTLRDSQLSVCEITRAVLDAASVIGTNLEVNKDLVAPGTDFSIRKHKVWPREGEGQSAQIPAVRNIPIDSHINELVPLLELFLSFADKESGLPPPSMGDVTGGGSEALRTQGGASMFLGAAALPIRDTVRNFDTFTTSVISALVKWNMKFDSNDSRDGDYNVIARGSTSLIAKEVLATSLDQFRATISEDEAPHINTRKLLEARIKARDLPVGDLLEDEDKANATIAQNAQAQQEQVQDQKEVVKAQVQQTLADAFKKVAEARKADSSIKADMFESVMRVLEYGDNSQAGAAGGGAAGTQQPAQ